MEEKNLNELNQSTNTKGAMDKERESALEEEKRVKVLSPGMLVVKRFLRNKLAIVGLAIIIAMFLFSFVGALFTPYSESQVFRKTEKIKKDYATAIYNKELRYTVVEGVDFSAKIKAQFLIAKTQKENRFEVEKKEYGFAEAASGVYAIGEYKEVATTAKGGTTLSGTGGFAVTPEFNAAYADATAKGLTGFVVGEDTYAISTTDKGVSVGRIEPMAMASALILDVIDAEYAALLSNYNFVFEAQVAVANGLTEFTVDGVTYQVEIISAEGDSTSGYIKADGSEIVEISNIIMSAKTSDVILSAEFKAAARAAIAEGEPSFEFVVTENDEETKYFASTVNGNIYITSMKETELINTFEGPTDKHILGTDKDGMDLMTRLMYGGRISLMVGFVVILIEMVLGVIIGGVSGFFGGWVDMVLMRFVDLFNSIPYWPMLIIAGSVMDGLQLESGVRIFTLMFILGFLNWTGIARVVRGQILTLREQEFMIACEANGIRTSRRIFKHLVPNVMPILIVQATMGLGGVIISEATLSFLGLGVKFPQASWGSIINSATDMYVMTNYWWIWIPAGSLILLTVLGFNFVGDGLRDAFDPKMKR